jgi:enterochelin esterase-like enzyme
MKNGMAVLLLIMAYPVVAQFPKVSSGKLERIENFPSKYISARNVDVWLPENYSSKEKYNVLYMHDGQMLFDSTTTWNKQEWRVDETAASLIKQHQIQNVVIVGIWNGSETRHKDYFPQRPFEQLTTVQRDTVRNQLTKLGMSKDFTPISDGYLKFIVNELKPVIDEKYSVYPDRAHTFIAGSSMGGLISMYAICEYPNVFGGAACISTHWPGTFAKENNPMPEAFANYLDQKLPDPKTHKIYFDYGDQTLDSMYPPLQIKIDEVMKKHNYSNKSWITRFFPGENHSERAWQKRLKVPLLFLLKK